MSDEDKKPETPVAPTIPTAKPEFDTAKEKPKSEADEFIEEYGELVKRRGMDFASYPVYVPDGQGGFRTVVQTTPVSLKNQPTKSPFVPEQ